VILVGLFALVPFAPIVKTGVAHAAAPAKRSSRACNFKHTVWGLVQTTATDVQYMQGYYNTDDVDNDKAQVLEPFWNAVARYGFPSGYYPLEVSLNDTWGHVWDYAYWDNLSWSDMSNGGDWQYDQGQENQPISDANYSMQTTWMDLKSICPGH
jgi:hypothetical protein